MDVRFRKLLLGGALSALLALSASGQEPPYQAGPDPAAAQPDATGPVSDGNGDVSFQSFYDSLTNEGTWIQTPDYGYVWQPNVTDPQWAPYTEGHWAYTDDGWTWVSDEPWGWATYHYGRWVNLDGTGWCWVPGYTWAPAWVSWRYGDGYVGWAPLPPDSMVGVDYTNQGTDADEADDGFHIGGDCDSYYDIGPGWYSFLPIGYLGDSNYRNYYVNRYNNYRLIGRTTNVTNLNLNRREARTNRFAGVSLRGPSVLQVDAQSQTPIERANLAYTDRVGGGAVNGGTFSIFAPHVNPGTAGQARPQAGVRSLTDVRVNRGTDISRPLRVSSQLETSGPTASQVQQAETARASAPANAGVARSDATPRTVTLTTMRPLSYPDYRGAAVEERPSANPYYSAERTFPTSNPRLYPGGGGYARPYASSGGVYRAPAGGSTYHGGGTPAAQPGISSPGGAVRH